MGHTRSFWSFCDSCVRAQPILVQYRFRCLHWDQAGSRGQRAWWKGPLQELETARGFTHTTVQRPASAFCGDRHVLLCRASAAVPGTSIVDSSSISFFFRCPSAGRDFATGRRDQFRRDWPPGMSVLIETSLGDMVFDLHTDLCPKVRPTALGVAVPSAPSAAPLRVS